MTCNRREPEEETIPATALLCVGEDELDNWWNSLDVEAKADAFAMWSLNVDGRNSHVYIEPAVHAASRVPVAGSVNGQGAVHVNPLTPGQAADLLRKHQNREQAVR